MYHLRAYQRIKYSDNSPILKKCHFLLFYHDKINNILIYPTVDRPLRPFTWVENLLVGISPMAAPKSRMLSLLKFKDGGSFTCLQASLNCCNMFYDMSPCLGIK